MSKLSELFRTKLSYSESQWSVIREDVRQAELFFHNLHRGRHHNKGGLNVTRNLALSWSARLLENSPTVKAFPSKASAIPKVRVANEVYRYVHRDQNFDAADFNTVLRAFKQSASAQFVYWDGDRGDDMIGPQRDEYGNFVLDEDGKEKTEVIGKYGSVAIREFGATEFCFGPGHDVEDALWFLVRLTMSEDELSTYLEGANADVDKAMGSFGESDMEMFLNNSGESERKYVVYDFWAVPGKGRKAHGRGLYTKSGQVIKETEWPLPFHTVPFCVLQVCPIDGSPFGTTQFWDVIKIQKEYDKHEKLVDEVMDMQRIIQFVHSSVYSKVNGAKHPRISVPNIGGIQGGIHNSEPPGVPEAVLLRSNQLLSNAYDAAGMNETLVGSERAGSNWSQQLIEYINRMDAQKQKGAYTSLASFIRRRARLVAKLFKGYASAKRVVAVVGENREWEALTFSGEDLQGTDFHFEEMPGSSALSSVAAAEVKDQVAQGQISPQAGAERIETGLGETLGEYGNVRDIRQYIDQAMAQSGPVEPPAGANPEEIIRQAEAKMAAGGNAEALKEIINRARLAMQQMQQQAAAAQQGQNVQ